jgi:aspartyl protease family protein
MARVVLKEVVIAEIAVRNVPAAVFPDNRLRIGLIRMSFLSKLSRFDIAGGRLLLKQ